MYKRKYKVNDIVCLRDSNNNITRGLIKKVTLQRYYVQDLSTLKVETYHWYFENLIPNHSTTGYDKHIDYLMERN